MNLILTQLSAVISSRIGISLFILLSLPTLFEDSHESLKKINKMMKANTNIYNCSSLPYTNI